MWIDRRDVGWLIGAKGMVIQKIQVESGCKLVIDQTLDQMAPESQTTTHTSDVCKLTIRESDYNRNGPSMSRAR